MHSDLIFDIGMNNGDDTAYYLHKGYRVVAVEANPLLAEKASVRFSEAVRTGRLIILNQGIADSCGTATFWVNEQHDEWSSFIKEIAGRHNLPCYPVEVACIQLKDLFAEYGVPYYLKIDIEGNDIYCLQDLTKTDLPVYVSVEAHRLEYLCLLTALGYTYFKCIDQTDHNAPSLFDNEAMNTVSRLPVTSSNTLFAKLRRRWPLRKIMPLRVKPIHTNDIQHVPVVTRSKVPDFTFAPGSSGPFGEDTFGEWDDLETTAYNWMHYKFGHKQRGTLNMNGWFDFHAKRTLEPS